MPGIRVLMEFASQDFAWSEAYYWLTATAFPTLQAAAQPALALASARVPLLGRGAALNRIRLSQYPASRQVVDLLPPGIPTTPSWGVFNLGGYSIDALQFTSSRPWVALLCLCSDSGGSTKQIYLAGIPCGLQQQEGFDEQGIYWNGAPGFLGRLQSFFGALNAYSFGWLSQRNETFQAVYQTPGAPNGLVTNAAYPGMVGVQVGQQLTFTDLLHPRVRIKGLRRLNIRLPGASGLWNVGAVLAPTPPATAPWTYFLTGSGLVQLTGYTGQGQVAAYFPSFKSIVTTQPVATVHRKRGVTLAGVRGRSSHRA